MKIHQLTTLILLLSFFSCDRIANKTKEGINRGGEVVGESATEFLKVFLKELTKHWNVKLYFQMTYKKTA
ncbi:hypothetical protein VDP25_02580 [Winogradskyella sp. ECml5-4]|uniref:hypothetical protein n=1 Tax=Winogradskyella sp. ECml5-4 TaxID=3110975 RepID=UPI002FF22DD2